MHMLYVILAEALVFILFCILVIKLSQNSKEENEEAKASDEFRDSPSTKCGRPMSKYMGEE